MTRHIRNAAVVAMLVGATLLGGCALVIGGAAVGAAVVLNDRRTSGAQVEDNSIEMRSVNRIDEVLGNKGHVNVTSYNRTVLLSGEVPTENDRSNVEKAVAKLEGVRHVVNELAVMPPSTMSSRSNDTYLTGMVKTAFLNVKDLDSTAVKVVTERGTVYLMGRVTEREANRATEVTRGVSGVKKVVRVFEILSEEELARLRATGN